MRTLSIASPSDCNGSSASSPNTPDPVPGLCRVVYGPDDDFFPVAGKSVASIRRSFSGVFNIPEDALPYIKGQVVSSDHVLAEGDHLEFLRLRGFKGVGEKVWDQEQFCQVFQITLEDLHAWIAQGLKVKRCLDGSIRITETAVDEFFRGRQIESPYLTAEEAAEYLRTTVKGVYGLLERRKLKKLSGSRTVLFTRDLLDAYLQGVEA